MSGYNLWVNATFGTQYKDDILRCVKSQNSDLFNISHWILASKYTDDTKADEALTQIAGVSYLTKALKDRTTIDGGLVLSTLLKLGENNEDYTTQTTWSGINGAYDTSQKGNGIAAWYGGDMYDKEDENTPNSVRTATSLIRMDGTGYLANGNISWNGDGSGSVAGGNVSWDNKGNVTLGNGVQIELGSSNSGLNATLTNVLNVLSGWNKFLVPVDTQLNEHTFEWALQNVELVHGIKVKSSLYAMGGLSALGVNDVSGGTGGGASYGRLDSWSDYDAARGDVLSAVLGAGLRDNIISMQNLLSALQDKINGNLNADMLDGQHANAFLRFIDTISNTADQPTLWNRIGIRAYNGCRPEGLTDKYTYGAVVSFPTQYARLDLHFSHHSSDTNAPNAVFKGLAYRSGWNDDKKDWQTILDTNNYSHFLDTAYQQKGNYLTPTDAEGYVKTTGNQRIAGNKTFGNQIIKGSGNCGWYNGRDNALICENNYAGYSVLWSEKTLDGSWDVGANVDNLCFTYIPDDFYNDHTNSWNGQIRFEPGGWITAGYFKRHGGTSSQFLKGDGSVDTTPYVSTNTAQTVTGIKTFAVNAWQLAANEDNEITSRHMANGTISGAIVGNGKNAAIRNGIDFRWYDSHCIVGSVRNDGTGSLGFGIGELQSDGTLTLALLANPNETIIPGVLKIGNAHISWDSDKGALKVDKPLYSTEGISVLGSTSGVSAQSETADEVALLRAEIEELKSRLAKLENL